MTTGHGLMGQAAFRQLRSMIDALLAKKADKSHRHSAFDVEFDPGGASAGQVTPVHLGVTGTGRCVSAFLPADGIRVEYSTDGGSTWVDYGADDANKRALACMRPHSTSYNLGGPSASGAPGDMLRVTYEPSDGRYGLVRSALVWVSQNGAGELLCSVETSTIGAKDAWVERVSSATMGGTSGPNVVDLPPLTFGGYEDQMGNTYGWRFTFSEKAAVTGITPTVISVDLYGDKVWSAANPMMGTGHMCSWDYQGNVTFPTEVAFEKAIAHTAAYEQRTSTATNSLTAQSRFVDTSTGEEVSVGVDSGHHTRGMYDDRLGKWLVYLDSDGSGHLNGNASTADYADSASYASSADVATKANRLSTARKISFTGAATGSATFDGSADITVSLAAQSTAASFLAAHPTGCVYATTKHTNPGTLYGGTWVERPSTGAFLYERTA